MRERKYVKFRVDMYADTKFKIIDMKPERDVIHYVWNRIVLLAGKVNLEGDLYLSKSIPYTIETLAIEFNRDIAQIKLAIELLIELEMLELSEDKIYRVKNFAKHQGIKVKEKEISNNKEEAVKNTKVLLNENFKVEINDDKDKKMDNRTSENALEAKTENLEITNKDILIADESKAEEKSRANLLGDIPIILETKKGTKKNKKQKAEIIDNIDTDEEIKDNSICCIHEGVIPLREGESSISEWSFG